MPPVFDVYEKFGELMSGTIIIRLHGPDRAGIEKLTNNKWNKIVAPKDGEIKLIVNMIQNLLSRGVDIYLNVNNHYEGSAPLTIAKIKEFM